MAPPDVPLAIGPLARRFAESVPRAFAPRMLLLGAVTLATLHGLAHGLDRAFFGAAIPPASAPFRAEQSPPGPLEWTTDDAPGHLARLALRPAWGPIAPTLALTDPASDGRTRGHAALLLLGWSAIVAVGGGAMARIASVGAAVGGREPLGAAVRYALARSFATMTALLAPAVTVAVVALPLGLLGLIGRVAPIVPAVAEPVSWVGGLMIAGLLLLASVAWPLMVLTVAAEGEDHFEAFSRGTAYARQRPSASIPLVVAAGVAVATGLALVAVVGQVAFRMAHWSSTLFGSPAESVAAESARAAWGTLARALADGATWPLFWSTSAVVYLALRQSVDGARWHDVHRPAVEASDAFDRPAAADDEG